MRAGIYLHLPFCLKKCPYCDFYSLPFDGETASRYVTALINEAEGFPALESDTLYFGGGTPSLLAPGETARLIDALSSRFSLPREAEITLECNPASADLEKLKAFKTAGVNRLSVGVQSTDEVVLRAAGRPHGAAEALELLKEAQRAGFENISADIMIGLPGDTPEGLAKTVREVCAAGVSHVSAYMLKLMEGTPFYENRPSALPSEDESAALYELCCEELEKRGFEQYEISNFARGEGFESAHNKKYWQPGRWLGLGAAAHSCLGKRRYSFPRDLKGFLARFERPAAENSFAEFLKFEGELEAADSIMLRLRTREGLDLKELKARFGASLEDKRDFIKKLEDAGLARFDDGVLRLTRAGFLVSNSVIAELI
ncbi:MAG: radical SAM family heme chaperone HemW [Oscillospiraceae bacterium]|nr:radical SAM family heme chaperone HemW [Oscillospiraceae bacterium]